MENPLSGRNLKNLKIFVPHGGGNEFELLPTH